MGITIGLRPSLARIILRFNRMDKALVVCRGYSDDDENFTELVWPDDQYLDFSDRESYPEFQLWVR